MAEIDVRGDSREPYEHYFREDGSPSPGLLGQSIQVWSAMQRGEMTIGHAAVVFNTSPDRIAEAVEVHPWLFAEDTGRPLPERVIEHEGE